MGFPKKMKGSTWGLGLLTSVKGGRGLGAGCAWEKRERTLERLTTEQVGLGKRFVKGSSVSGIIISRGGGNPADDFARTALSAAPDGPARPRAWEWAGRLTASKYLLPQQDVSRTHTSAEAAGVPAPGALGQSGMSWEVWCRGGPESSEPGGPSSGFWSRLA